MRVINLRIFVASSCQECKKFRKAMEMHGFDCDYIDVNADENDALCDRLGIEEVPVFQAFDSESDEVIMTYDGYNSPLALMAMLADELEEYNPDTTINGVTEDNGISKRSERPRQKGCGGCKSNSRRHP